MRQKSSQFLDIIKYKGPDFSKLQQSFMLIEEGSFKIKGDSFTYNRVEINRNEYLRPPIIGQVRRTAMQRRMLGTRTRTTGTRTTILRLITTLSGVSVSTGLWYD